MKHWLNWREIEKTNVWNMLREGNEEFMCRYADEDIKQERLFGGETAARRQTAMMTRLGEDSSVLIAGGGTLALTIPVAQRAGTVYVQDSSDARLEALMRQAESLHLDNIIPVLGDWYTLTPGEQFPICDISIARHAPCQGNILAFSTTAREYCYSLWSVFPLEEPVAGADRESEDEPDRRLNGFHVHFNLLYDAGANPEVRYDTVSSEYFGESPEDIACQIIREESTGEGSPPRTLLEKVRREAEPLQDQYRYCHVQRMSILGWDPKKVNPE